MKKREVFKRGFVLTVALVALFLIFKAIYMQKMKNEDIELNKVEIIGKVYDFTWNKNFKYYYYLYYYNGVEYKNYDDIDYGEEEKSIKRYYKVILSSKNPENSKLLINEETIDSVEIANAGFISQSGTSVFK
jgi:hypothetical protein